MIETHCPRVQYENPGLNWHSLQPLSVIHSITKTDPDKAYFSLNHNLHAFLKLYVGFGGHVDKHCS